MTSTAAGPDGDGSRDAGIGMSPTPSDLDGIRATVDKVAAAHDERQRSIARARRLLVAIGGSGDEPYVADVIAETNAAAAQDLDDLLRTLRRGGIGTSPAGTDPDASATDRARSSAQRWADAGYTSPSAVAAWTAIGIDTPEIARQWSDAGFTAQSASGWVLVADLTPAEAATCVAGGMTPSGVQRIRRADPGWARPELEPEPAPAKPEPDLGISM